MKRVAYQNMVNEFARVLAARGFLRKMPVLPQRVLRKILLWVFIATV